MPRMPYVAKGMCQDLWLLVLVLLPARSLLIPLLLLAVLIEMPRLATVVALARLT